MHQDVINEYRKALRIRKYTLKLLEEIYEKIHELHLTKLATDFNWSLLSDEDKTYCLVCKPNWIRDSEIYIFEDARESMRLRILSTMIEIEELEKILGLV